MAQVESEVQPRATDWFALVDAGDGPGSWRAAGASFQAASTPEAWADKLRAARGPLGPATSRALAVEQAADGLPGAPPGRYVVQQYHAVYDGRNAVVETLTLRAEDDGVWRVVGYFVR